VKFQPVVPSKILSLLCVCYRCPLLHIC